MARRHWVVLVVSAEDALVRLVGKALKPQGFRLRSARTIAEADESSRAESFDVAVLDLSLDPRRVPELCRLLRSRTRAPIIILSTLAELAQDAAGQAGASDYLVVPFSPEDFVAQVRELVGWSGSAERSTQADVIAAGRLVIDLTRKHVVRAGARVRLTRREWALLEELLRNRNKVLPHRMLLQRVWGERSSEEVNYLRFYIRQLRQKLEEDPANPRHLLTEQGIGYRFVVPPSSEPDAPPPAHPAPEPAERSTVTAPAAPGEPAWTGLPSLEAPPRPLIGRAGELAALRALLLQPEVRLVTLTGPGGTGKTYLSLHIADELQRCMRDGVALVQLIALRDPRLVIPAIARALGMGDAPPQAAFASLQQTLGPRELLLVLDNFEHLLPAAPALSDLLIAAPGLKLLITSRVLLHLACEHAVALPPLPFPQGGEQLTYAEIRSSPAVELFVERAQSMRPGFTLTPENALVVAHLCRQLDGLPLAIELAAARLKLLSLAQLSERVESRLDLLSRGFADLPERHQSLRRTMDWSYGLLPETEQRVFAWLGVLDAGFSLDDAARLLSRYAAGDARYELPVDVLDSLTTLLNSSLLQRLPGSARRFAMLGLVREYALEQLTGRSEAAMAYERLAQLQPAC